MKINKAGVHSIYKAIVHKGKASIAKKWAKELEVESLQTLEEVESFKKTQGIIGN